MRKSKSEYNAKYWAEHKEQITAHRRQYYQENKDKIDKRNRKWLDANRDRWNEYMRERRAKLKLDKEKQQ